VRIEVRGREHVPAEGSLLVVSNHVSVLDPPFVGGACPANCLPRKEELFACRSSGDSSTRSMPAPVKRDGSDGRALKAALKLLGENRRYSCFPRAHRGWRTLAKATGRGHLAVLSGAPVGTAYVSGTAQYARDGAPPGPPRHCDLRSPSSQSVGDERRKERYREATGEMMRAIAQFDGAASRSKA